MNNKLVHAVSAQSRMSTVECPPKTWLIQREKKNIQKNYSILWKIQFSKLLNAIFVLRLGLPAPFATSAERKEMFQKMDENGDGSISFDEWLGFSLEQIFKLVV